MLYGPSCVLSAEHLLLLYVASDRDTEQLSFRDFWQRRVSSVRSPRTLCFKDIVRACLMPSTVQGWNQQLQRI